MAYKADGHFPSLVLASPHEEVVSLRSLGPAWHGSFRRCAAHSDATERRPARGPLAGGCFAPPAPLLLLALVADRGRLGRKQQSEQHFEMFYVCAYIHSGCVVHWWHHWVNDGAKGLACGGSLGGSPAPRARKMMAAVQPELAAVGSVSHAARSAKYYEGREI